MRRIDELEIHLQHRDDSTYSIGFRFTAFGSDEPQILPAVGFFRPPTLRPFDAELDPADYGRKLGEAFFADPGVRAEFAKSRRPAADCDGLCLRLVLPDELQSLRWETMFDPDPTRRDTPLAAGGRVFLGRYLSSQARRGPGPRSTSPPSVLIAIANPAGDFQPQDDGAPSPRRLWPIDVPGELDRAKAALGELIREPDILTAGKATPTGLMAALKTGVDILYLVCHGALIQGEAMLWLEPQNPATAYIPVAATELIRQIGDLPRPPRLVVLASCQSAGDDKTHKTRDSGILSALGPRLAAEAGVGAVVALQGNFAMSTAKVFMPEFFRHLADTGELDSAMTQARGLARDTGAHDFWMPVLFSRLPNAALSGLAGRTTQSIARVCNVPSLPAGFVPRPRLESAIVTALIGESNSSPGANTVVHGPGGFGKTTLAMAVGLSSKVTDATPGGVLWTSLGTKPNLAQILSDLHVAAKGVKPDVAGQEQLVQSLAEALRENSWLIALDDVWRAEDLEPFLQLGSQRLLVSTRNQMLIQEAGQDGWREVQVDEMEPDEAAVFLSRGLGQEGPPPDAFHRLAEQLGGWPLLLDLANARLREEKKSGRGINFVSRLFEKKGVLGFDRRDTTSRTSAVALSVEVGLEQAEKMSPGLARKAVEISIFPENIAIPVQVLQDLWSLDEFDIEDVLRPLGNLSLVRWDRETGEIRVHRMIDRALDERLKEADGGPARVHRRLIEAWGDPRRLPHDYAWRWFGWNCNRADELGRLKELLQAFSWLQAKLDAADANALIGDFELVPAGDRQLELLKSAVRLSAHVLARDKSQLAGQLLGRIPQHEETLRAGILKEALLQDRAWLRPLRPTLTVAGGALLRTLAGHSDNVCGVAVTTDGGRVVSASRDNTLKVWDLETGTELRTLGGHFNWVSDVTVTTDGKWAVSASWDNTLRVWDLETGVVLRTLAGHSDWVNGVALTANGKRAVSASADNTLKMWDLETGTELRTLTGHFSGVNGVAVTADGRRAISASADNTLKVWDLESGIELDTLTGHSGPVNSVAVTADGRRAVSASRDNMLKVWDLEAGTELRTLAGHSSGVIGVAVTADGRRAVSASADNTLKVWDLETGTELHALTGHSGNINDVAVTGDGRRAVSASADYTLKVWDLEAGTESRLPAGHSRSVKGVAVTADGRRAVSASEDHTLKVWNSETGGELRTMSGHALTVSGVAVTVDGRRVISASYDRTLRVWDPETGSKIRTLKGHSHWVSGVAVAAVGTQVVSASWDKTLKIWDLETGTELRTLSEHSDAVNCVAVTADGSRAISLAFDDTLKVWNLETGKVLRTLEGHVGVTSVAVAADGRRAVSASSDHTLKVWDLEACRELRTLDGHSNGVSGVALTADGKRAVSCSEDNTLKVWDLDSGVVLASFTCDGSAFCCAFVADHGVIVGDEAGRVHFLHLEEPYRRSESPHDIGTNERCPEPVGR